jgi:transposase-like protein
MAKKTTKKPEKKPKKLVKKTTKKPTKKPKSFEERGMNCTKCRKRYKNLKERICHYCGRGSDLNDEMRKDLARVLRLDYPISKACAYVGIAKTTYYNWIKRYPDFAKEMKKAKYYATDLARKSVTRNMQHDGHLALKYLERKEKDEFSTKQFIQEQIPTGELELDEKKEMIELLGREGIEIEGVDEIDDLLGEDFK